MVLSRLIMGDCLEKLQEIEAGSVDMILTDPPYGTTACKWDAVIPFEPMWREVWQVLKPNGAAVFTASQPFTSRLIVSELKNFRYEWVWDKVNRITGALTANKMPMKRHENICVFYIRLPTYNKQSIMKKRLVGGRYAANGVHLSRSGRDYQRPTSDDVPHNPNSILSIEGWMNNNHHPTQKPVALMEYLIRTYTNEGERVLDFTMGSGTTGVAAMNTGRKFIGIERDPTYFAVAEKRIEEARLSWY